MDKISHRVAIPQPQCELPCKSKKDLIINYVCNKLCAGADMDLSWLFIRSVLISSVEVLFSSLFILYHLISAHPIRLHLMFSVIWSHLFLHLISPNPDPISSWPYFHLSTYLFMVLLQLDKRPVFLGLLEFLNFDFFSWFSNLCHCSPVLCGATRSASIRIPFQLCQNPESFFQIFPKDRIMNKMTSIWTLKHPSW